MIEAKPEKLIGDKAYDSDGLDTQLRQDGIEMIAPHRVNRRKKATQDGRALLRYQRRWLVERFFAWVQRHRRLLTRWEYYARNFLGFVQLACVLILRNNFEIGSTVMLLSALALTGCINREAIRYSDDWPSLVDSVALYDLAGRYPNAGEGAGDRLWHHLTKDEYSMRDAQVALSVRDQTSLTAQLIEGTNVLKTVALELDKDFILKRDHLHLPTRKGFERGALGSGGGYTEFYLYRTVDGSLAGKLKGVAVGLCMHVIPTVGFGTKWTRWPKIESHNNALLGAAHKVRRTQQR